MRSRALVTVPLLALLAGAATPALGQAPSPGTHHHGAAAPTASMPPATSAAPGSSDPGDPQHQHPPAPPEGKPALPAFIPPVTDADRAAAFPDVEGHAVHDKAVHSYVLFDQVEWQSGEGGGAVNVDARGWVGRDRDRFWFRAEGDGAEGSVEEAKVDLLYGRQIARWWDLVAGVRQDFRPGSLQTWAAVGIQGLAPYWFEIEATGYIGASGRTAARVEVEYEWLLTNRMMLQPLFEIEIAGKTDPERGVGAGVSTTDLGFRLRYEIKRELAPYAGVTWTSKWGKTGDYAEAAGEDRGGARFVAGIRLWF